METWGFVFPPAAKTWPEANTQTALPTSNTTKTIPQKKVNILLITCRFVWEIAGGGGKTYRPRFGGGGETHFWARPPELVLEGSESGIGLVCGHSLFGKWQGVNKEGGDSRDIPTKIPGYPAQKVWFPGFWKDIPNFLATTPSRGRPPPYPKISPPKSLALGSFFSPEIWPQLGHSVTSLHAIWLYFQDSVNRGSRFVTKQRLNWG